jgi:hypothetical protein
MLAITMVTRVLAAVLNPPCGARYLLLSSNLVIVVSVRHPPWCLQASWVLAADFDVCHSWTSSLVGIEGRGQGQGQGRGRDNPDGAEAGPKTGQGNAKDKREG